MSTRRDDKLASPTFCKYCIAKVPVFAVRFATLPTSVTEANCFLKKGIRFSVVKYVCRY